MWNPQFIGAPKAKEKDPENINITTSAQVASLVSLQKSFEKKVKENADESTSLLACIERKIARQEKIKEIFTRLRIQGERAKKESELLQPQKSSIEEKLAQLDRTIESFTAQISEAARIGFDEKLLCMADLEPVIDKTRAEIFATQKIYNALISAEKASLGGALQAEYDSLRQEYAEIFATKEICEALISGKRISLVNALEAEYESLIQQVTVLSATVKQKHVEVTCYLEQYNVLLAMLADGKDIQEVMSSSRFTPS